MFGRRASSIGTMPKVLTPFLRSILRLSFIGTAFSAVNLLPGARFGALFELNQNLATYYLVGHLFVLLLLPLFYFTKILRLGTFFFYCVVTLLLAWDYASPMVRFVEPSWKERRYIPGGIKTEKLRVLFANVEMGNLSASKHLREIEQREQPDILGLVEVTPSLLRELSLKERYPYAFEHPEEGHFGLALYSKYPLGNEPVVSLGEQLPTVYINTLQVGEAELELIVFHPPPPVSGDLWMANRLLSRRLATRLRNSVGNTIILGDFNATPHSRHYELIVHGGGMHNAMEGYGWNRTWNMHHPLIRLPIDHVLFRGGIEVANWQTVEGFGSDHLPLLVDFRVQQR